MVTVEERAGLAEAFEAERGRLQAIAARVLGSQADAEDVVQEAWIRLERQPAGSINHVEGWLTTVVGRISIDVLRTRTAKPEVPFEFGLSEVVVTEDLDSPPGPEDTAILADSLGVALLVVLGTLEPEERMAFVLHDLFAVPFAQIGEILGKSSDAAKMSASRARRKVRAAPSESPTVVRLREQRRVVDAFIAAAREGDFATLLEVLDPDLVWTTRTARGVREHVGREEILDLLARSDRRKVTAHRVLVDGRPGVLAWNRKGQPVGLMSCTVEDGRMTRIDSIVDVAWLATHDLPPAPTHH